MGRLAGSAPFQHSAHKDQECDDPDEPQPCKDYFQKHRITPAMTVNHTHISLAERSPTLWRVCRFLIDASLVIARQSMEAYSSQLFL